MGRVTQGLPLDVARALLSTFRPRMDVFAERFDDQRAVDRINAWMRARGEHRPFRVGDWKPSGPRDARHPLTVEALAEHVAGRRTVGFYPLHPDNTCNSVSVDLDAHRGALATQGDPFADLDALMAVCLRRGVRFLANVSRGGKGAWLHVLPPVGTPAHKGRAILSALVRDAGLKHVCDGGSLDSIFPKADDLSTGCARTPGNVVCVPVCGRWLHTDPPGTHFYNTDPRDLRAQLRALTGDRDDAGARSRRRGTR